VSWFLAVEAESLILTRGPLVLKRRLVLRAPLVLRTSIVEGRFPRMVPRPGAKGVNLRWVTTVAYAEVG
jgi:hypothetical protein